MIICGCRYFNKPWPNNDSVAFFVSSLHKFLFLRKSFDDFDDFWFHFYLFFILIYLFFKFMLYFCFSNPWNPSYLAIFHLYLMLFIRLFIHIFTFRFWKTQSRTFLNMLGKIWNFDMFYVLKIKYKLSPSKEKYGGHLF